MANLENIVSQFDPEDEEDQEPSPKKSRLTKIRAGKELLELFSKPEREQEEPDKTPELDAEAPLEHLSQVEELAVSQTLAEQRLAELKAEESEAITNEYLAAANYLEAVASTGYIEDEFESAINELGAEEDVPTLSVGQKKEPKKSPPKSTKKAAPEFMPRKSAEKKANESKESNTIADFLMNRREGRLTSVEAAPAVKVDLAKEIGQIRGRLEARESQVRRLASAKPEFSPEEEITVDEILKKTENVSELDNTRPVEILEEVQAEIKAQTINRNELLAIASTIEIEGTPLSAIFANNLIGEKGLRRVVAEFLRGGDVKKALRREVVEREMDFERDPILRDRGDGSSLENKSSSVDSLLAKSGIGWDDEQQTILSNSTKQQSKLKSALSNAKPSNIRTIDVVMVGGILTLIVILIIVVVSK